MLPKERFAWIWIAALLLVFGGYFSAVNGIDALREASPLMRIGLLAAALAMLGLIAGTARLLIAARSDEDETEDERDHDVERRSASVAYYVLMAGMIVVGCVMPFSSSGWELVHAALLAIVLAEVVHSSMVVVGYRAAGVSERRLVNNLRTLRFLADEMTQAELGRQIGVTRQTIAAIESGKYSPSLEAAFRLADVFGKPLEDVFAWEEA